jgi:co-chaperonin GroES (HSP10)
VRIRPWGDYIALSDPPADPQDGALKSGIYLPESSSVAAFDKGIVIGLGPCVESNDHTPDGFGPGAVVWYAHGHALEVGSRDDNGIKFIQARYLIAWEPAEEM